MNLDPRKLLWDELEAERAELESTVKEPSYRATRYTEPGGLFQIKGPFKFGPPRPRKPGEVELEPVFPPGTPAVPYEEPSVWKELKKVPAAFDLGGRESALWNRGFVQGVESSEVYETAAELKRIQEAQGPDEPVVLGRVAEHALALEFKKFGLDVADVAQQTARMVLPMAKGGAGALVGAAAGSAVPGIGTAAGAIAGATSAWTIMMGGMLRLEMINAGIEDRYAMPIAAALAAPYALVEVEQAKRMLPVGAAARTVVAPAVKAALAKVAVKFGKDWAKNVGQEGAQRIIEEVTKDAGATLQEWMGGKKVERPGLLYSLVEAPVEEMEAVAPAFLPMLAPGAAITAADVAAYGRKAAKVATEVERVQSIYKELGVEVAAVQAPVEPAPAEATKPPAQTPADAQRALSIWQEYMRTGDEAILGDMPPGAEIPISPDEVSASLAKTLDTPEKRATFKKAIPAAIVEIERGGASRVELLRELRAYEGLWGKQDPLPAGVRRFLGMEAPPAEAPTISRMPTEMVNWTMDPRLLEVLRTSHQGGDLPKVVMKELYQNAVAAVQGLPDPTKGEITINFDSADNTMMVEDNGIGMTPNDVKTKFLPPGATGKVAGDVGGFGVAKIPILGNSAKFQLITRAFVGDELVQTTVVGTGVSWLNNEKIPVQTEVVEKSLGTGTQMKLELRPEITGWWTVRAFVEKTLRPGAPYKVQVPGHEYMQKTAATKYADVSEVARIPIPKGEAVLSASKGLGSQRIGAVVVNVLMDGAPQFDHVVYTSGDLKTPNKVELDVKSKADVMDMDAYPFTSNRESFKDWMGEIVNKAVRDFITVPLIESEADRFRRALDRAVKLERDTMILDSTEQIPDELLTRIKGDDLTSLLEQLSVAHTEFADTVGQIYLEKNEAAKASALALGKFSGIAIDNDFEGVNVPASILYNDPREVGRDAFINPFSLIDDLVGADMIDAEYFANAVVATLIHEMVHHVEPGHGVAYSTALTDVIQYTLRDASSWSRRIQDDVERTGSFSRLVSLTQEVTGYVSKDSLLRKFADAKESERPGGLPAPTRRGREAGVGPEGAGEPSREGAKPPKLSPEAAKLSWTNQYTVDWAGQRQAFPSIQAAEAWIRENVPGASELPIKPIPEKTPERTRLSRTIHVWKGRVFKGETADVQYRDFLKKAIGIDSTKYATEDELGAVKTLLRELAYPQRPPIRVTTPPVETPAEDPRLQAIVSYVRANAFGSDAALNAVVNWVDPFWDKVPPPIRSWLVKFAAGEFRKAGTPARVKWLSSFRYVVEDLTKSAGNTALLKSWYQLTNHSGLVKNWLYREFQRMQEEAGVHFTYINAHPEQRELFARALFEEKAEEQARLVAMMDEPTTRLFTATRKFSATGGEGANAIRGARWQEWNYWDLELQAFKEAHPEIWATEKVVDIPPDVMKELERITGKLEKAIPANVKPEQAQQILAAGRAAWAKGWKPFKEWVATQEWGTRAEYFLSATADMDSGADIESFLHISKTPFKEGKQGEIREPKVRGLTTREEGARPLLEGDILRQLYMHFYRAELNSRALPFLRSYKRMLGELGFVRGADDPNAAAGRNILERNLMNIYAKPETGMWPMVRIAEQASRWFWFTYFLSNGPWFFIRNLGQVALSWGHLNAGSSLRSFAQLVFNGGSAALKEAMSPGGEYDGVASQREAMEREWIMLRPGVEFEERLVDKLVGMWAATSDNMTRMAIYPVAWTTFERAVAKFRSRGMTNGARRRFVSATRLDGLTGLEQLLIWEKIAEGDDKGAAALFALTKTQATNFVYKTTGRSAAEQWRIGKVAMGLVTFARGYAEQYTRNALRNIISGIRTNDYGRAWRGTTMVARLYVGMILMNVLLKNLIGRRRGPDPYDPIDLLQYTPPGPGAQILFNATRTAWQAVALARDGKVEQASRLLGTRAEAYFPLLNVILRLHESIGNRAGATATNLIINKFGGKDTSVKVRRSAVQAFAHAIFGTEEYPKMGRETMSEKQFKAFLGLIRESAGAFGEEAPVEPTKLPSNEDELDRMLEEHSRGALK